MKAKWLAAGVAVLVGVALVVGIPAAQAATPGVSGVVTVKATGTIQPQSSATVVAFCPAGKVALGGGVMSSAFDAVIMGSVPNVVGGATNGNGWTGLVRNANVSSPITADAWAVCATVT